MLDTSAVRGEACTALLDRANDRANSTGLVLGCIEAKTLQETLRSEAPAEIRTMQLEVRGGAAPARAPTISDLPNFPSRFERFGHFTERSCFF